MTVKPTKPKKFTACILCLSSTGVDAAVTVGGMDAAVEAIGIYLRRVTEATAHTPLEAINIINIMDYQDSTKQENSQMKR